MDWRRKITKLWKFLMISFLNCSTETEAKENNNDPVEYARTSQDLDEHKNFLVKSTDKYSPPEIIAVSGRVRDTSTQEAIEINRLE
jgi:hypothetical protein